MKKAFTLIEMLVVLGILGILAAILLGVFRGSTESARSVKCMANMHNLGNAYGLKGGPAGSHLDKEPVMGTHQVDMGYIENPPVGEKPGWISWFSNGGISRFLPDNPNQLADNNSHLLMNKQKPDWFVSTYTSDEDARTYCLTNGTFWVPVGRNRNVYVCPVHLALATARKCSKPCWSYVMNGTFDVMLGQPVTDAASDPWQGGGNSFKEQSGERTLLFCELPFVTIKGFQTPDYSDTPGSVNDPTLQYKGCDANYSGDTEVIGFNHRSGNRYVAHVCFADVHVEKLSMPAKMTKKQAEELTVLLANGKDFSFNGQKYEEVK